MEWWQQLILAVLGSGALFTFLGVLTDRWLTRIRTKAEARSLDGDALVKKSAAHKTDADASRTDAETAQLYINELRAAMSQWKGAMDDWGECVRQKAEAEAERDRLGTLAESYRFQLEKAQELETELRGQIQELRK